jgi:DNA-binding transcriptional LysR family regulator
MSLKSLDLNLFQTFEAIYDRGNLTQAAQILNITQPAVSNALHRLRENLDDPLFIHAGRKMNPTPMAQKMIGPVRQALRLLETSIEPEDKFNPATSERTLRLGIGDIGETILLPPLVDVLQKEAPMMKIQALQVPRRSMPKKLALGQVDVAIDIPQLTSSELMYSDLMSDRQVCVVGLNHPLAKTKSLSLEQYLAMSHILVSSRARGGGIVDIELGRLGSTRKIAIRLQHYQAAFHMLQSTDYSLTAPLQLTRMYPCHAFELPLTVPNLEFRLYWHRSSDQVLSNQWLRQQILSAAGVS